MHNQAQAYQANPALSIEQIQKQVALAQSQGIQAGPSSETTIVSLTEQSHVLSGAIHSAISGLEERLAGVTDALPQIGEALEKDTLLPPVLDSLTMHNRHLKGILSRLQSLAARVRV